MAGAWRLSGKSIKMPIPGNMQGQDKTADKAWQRVGCSYQNNLQQEQFSPLLSLRLGSDNQLESVFCLFLKFLMSVNYKNCSLSCHFSSSISKLKGVLMLNWVKNKKKGKTNLYFSLKRWGAATLKNWHKTCETNTAYIWLYMNQQIKVSPTVFMSLILLSVQVH